VKRLVILGAGYAGIQATRRAERAEGDIDITLVDQNGYHQLVTEMYRVVAGEVDEEALTLPVRHLIDTERVTFRRASVKEIRRGAHLVATDAGDVPYDALVIALGSEPEYYHVPGAARYAYTLQYIDSARRLRHRLGELMGREKAPRVVVVGGGLTGVELIAEIGEYLTHHFPRQTVHPLTLVQAAPQILPEETDDLVRYAEKVMGGFDIDIREATPVKEVGSRAVVLGDGTVLPSDLTIWAGGVRANAVPCRSGLPADKRGRIEVDLALQVKGSEGVFAAGDVALALDPSSGRPLPPTAQLAVAGGRVAGDNAVALLEGRALRTFRPKGLGVIASLGRTRGVADFRRFRLKGRAAMVAKKLALWRYLIGVEGIGMGFREVPFSWWQAGPEDHAYARPANDRVRNRSLGP